MYYKNEPLHYRRTHPYTDTIREPLHWRFVPQDVLDSNPYIQTMHVPNRPGRETDWLDTIAADTPLGARRSESVRWRTQHPRAVDVLLGILRSSSQGFVLKGAIGPLQA